MPNLPPTADRRCGTDAGYQAHRYRDEDACDRCRDAHAIHQLEWMDKNPDQRADATVTNRVRYRAMAELAKNHPDEYRSILQRHKENPS